MSSAAAIARTYKTDAKVRDAALSQIERAVLSICEQAAEDGRPLESIEEIMNEVGVDGFSTVPGIMKRLEEKGFIRRNIYQRGRQVCIVATGQCTAPPKCTAPHWRLRPKSEPIPTPAIHLVRQQSISAQIEQDARSEGKSMAEHLMSLIYIGHHAYRAEREAEAA